MERRNTLDEVRTIVASALDLGSRAGRMDASTALLGAVPELDSMAVMNIIVALEERFDIAIDDDEVNASTFATLGSLLRFVDGKLDARGDLSEASESSGVNA